MVEAQEPPEARRSRQPDLAAESSNSGNTTGGHGLPAVVVSLSITGSGAAPGPLLLDKSPLQQLPQQAEVESQVRLQAQGSTPPTSWSRAVLHGQQNQAHAHQQQLPDQNLDDHQHPQPRPEEVDLETLAPTPLQGANEPGVIAKEGYEVIKRPVDVTIPSSTISTPPTSSHTILPTTITTSTTTIFSSATVSASRTTTTATATPATTEGSTAAGDNTSSSRSSSRSGSSGSSSGGGGSKSSASGSTTTTTLTPTTTVTTEPFISTLRDGLTTVRRDQQHNRCAPLSLSSANMSNPPQHPSHTRPPLGFPSPPYASPPQGLGGHSHYGYGNPLPPGPDQYRPGPPTPVGSNNPLSLPSMRTFDTLQHQQAQQSPMAAQMMQVQAGMSYYPQPVPVPGNPNPYSLPPEAMAQRYPLPPNDPRVMLGGPPRNKKVLWNFFSFFLPDLKLRELPRATLR
ncbi:hypothetical protein BX600DRAFT_104146 [Xylariales sp. PMI_506]|nr:hypothetical protein BX600DRAFT_104146 [Xylariales sp. PMI_506]